jgi:AraC family transcriptional regulator, regulatory protein of adaptative response / methylated-DNA-[protein]-cysteine methyltransferase
VPRLPCHARCAKLLDSSSPMQITLRYSLAQTSIAALLIAVGPAGLVAVIIREDPQPSAMVGELARRFPKARLLQDPAGTSSEVTKISNFVEAPVRNIDLPLDIHATDFQRQVYREVLTIPFGQTTTFADIASRIGSPKAVRAVGSACTRNPLEFAIPCHRVLRSDGTWSGGGKWGNWRQCTLLSREAAAIAMSSQADLM